MLTSQTFGKTLNCPAAVAIPLNASCGQKLNKAVGSVWGLGERGDKKKKKNSAASPRNFFWYHIYISRG